MVTLLTDLLRQSRTIEKVQRRAMKLLPEISKYSYGKRLQFLNLPSLKYRRLRGDLIQVYKFLHNSKEHDFMKFFTLSTSKSTRGHDLKLFKHPCKTNLRKYSFTNRIVDTWNNLTNETVHANNLNHFKKLLDYDLKDFYYIYD